MQVDDQLPGLSIIRTLAEKGLNAKHDSLFVLSNDIKKLVRVWTKYLSASERLMFSFCYGLLDPELPLARCGTLKIQCSTLNI